PTAAQVGMPWLQTRSSALSFPLATRARSCFALTGPCRCPLCRKYHDSSGAGSGGGGGLLCSGSRGPRMGWVVAGTGIWSRCPHCGQLILFPPCSAGAVRMRWHAGHEKRIMGPPEEAAESQGISECRRSHPKRPPQAINRSAQGTFQAGLEESFVVEVVRLAMQHY